MPSYTLIHGGLTLKQKQKTPKGEIEVNRHFPHGSEVELSVEEAAHLNRREPHVKLTAVLKAEAEAEKKKAEIIAAAEKKALEEIASLETKKHGKDGAK